ncbi:translation initiation factor IF-2 [Rouxiella silvae]|uniref:Translation initiation factor IF-2 n=1 Tax=Rouxiella silvae TaxID=1646373 RepID=A0ABX3TXU2_9GAMM|nr:Gp138 family membrane-puncturing spike protein [Rouxiella silvae]ORJ20036.1 translation initiation factor IF-2 [Rouxiella silvae]
MPVSNSAQTGDTAALTEALAKDISSNLRVSMPGIIQSFDPGDDTRGPTCVVLPAIKGTKTDSDGNVTSEDYPLLVDVPMVFPRGGGVTLTFPIGEGDECLLVFSDRCIDFWWQSGGVQEAVDKRQHDLSDAFAIVGLQSGATKISNISTTAVQLRTDDGASFIELKQGGAVNIKSTLVTIDGDVQVNGAITSTGDQTAAGISQTGHVHGGVESGGSNTGEPQ